MESQPALETSQMEMDARAWSRITDHGRIAHHLDNGRSIRQQCQFLGRPRLKLPAVFQDGTGVELSLGRKLLILFRQTAGSNVTRCKCDRHQPQKNFPPSRRPPKIVSLAVDLREHLVQMSAPPTGFHSVNPPLADRHGKHHLEAKAGTAHTASPPGE